jgi:hypothetical protein
MDYFMDFQEVYRSKEQVKEQERDLVDVADFEPS